PARHKPDPTAERPKFNGHAPPGLERFHEPLKAISAFNYGDCIRVGQALHHESGGSEAGLAMFDAWAATCQEKWAQGWAAEKWKTFKRGGVTGGTIFALAEQHGWSKPERAHTKQREKANGGNGADLHFKQTEDADEKPKPEGLRLITV